MTRPGQTKQAVVKNQRLKRVKRINRAKGPIRNPGALAKLLQTSPKPKRQMFEIHNQLPGSRAWQLIVGAAVLNSFNYGN
jgi:hypothetical protein